jgi:hypothetical protein
MNNLPGKYNYDEQIKEDEMAGTCRTHSVEVECLQNLSRKPEKTDYWEEVRIDKRIILKLTLKEYTSSVWMGLLQISTGTGGRLLRMW